MKKVVFYVLVASISFLEDSRFLQFGGIQKVHASEEINFPLVPSVDLLEVNRKNDNIIEFDYYRWLEENSPDRQSWLQIQRKRTSRYMENEVNAKITRYWENILQKNYTEDRVIGYLDLGDNRKILLLSKNKGDDREVVLEENGVITKEFLRSVNSSSTRSSIPYFWLDPPKKHVIVPLSFNGSSNAFKVVYIFNIKSGKEVAAINNVYSSGGPFVWKSQASFFYDKVLGTNRITLSREIGDNEDKFRQVIDLFNSPKTNFIYGRKNGRVNIKGINDDEYTYIDFDFQKIEAETDRFLYVSKKENGWNVLYQIEFGKENKEYVFLSPKKVKNIKEGVFINSYEVSGDVLLNYRFGKNRWSVLFGKDGQRKAYINTPDCCSVHGFETIDNNKIKVSLSSQIVRKKNFIYNIELQKFENPNLKRDMLTDNLGIEYVNTYLETTSKDGTKILVRVVHRKDIKLTGDSPTIAEGYGGFSEGGYFSPSFHVETAVFIKDGGVYIAPTLRGGNEFGPEWAKAGQFAQKINTFDDMNAAIQLVTQLKYSSPNKIAIMGGSNGGLLVGAMATRYPENFKLGIVINGVLDLLRKDLLNYKFDRGWSYEYGSTSNDKSFNYLKEISPLHNITEKEYPTMLIVNGTHDLIVDPSHSFKFSASLQDAQTGSNPILLLPMDKSGHVIDYQGYEGNHAYKTRLNIWRTIYQELGVSIKEEGDETDKT